MFPRARSASPDPWFLSWPGLLLERTDALNNQFAPIFRPEISGELEGNAGDDTARAVSNNRVNEASTAGL
jgi:hypothetical protein